MLSVLLDGGGLGLTRFSIGRSVSRVAMGRLTPARVAANGPHDSAATEEVSASAEEMSAQVEEMSAQAEELAATADHLRALAARFTLEVEAARRAPGQAGHGLRRVA